MIVVRRRAALLLGGLFLAALLGAQAHRATELHALCSKHGEVVHLHGAGPVTGAPAPRTTVAPGVADELEHGCAALLFLGTAALAVRPAASALVVDAAPASHGPTPGRAARPPVPLLHEAPKHSPPVG